VRRGEGRKKEEKRREGTAGIILRIFLDCTGGLPHRGSGGRSPPEAEAF